MNFIVWCRLLLFYVRIVTAKASISIPLSPNTCPWRLQRVIHLKIYYSTRLVYRSVTICSMGRICKVLFNLLGFICTTPRTHALHHYLHQPLNWRHFYGNRAPMLLVSVLDPLTDLFDIEMCVLANPVKKYFSVFPMRLILCKHFKMRH